jgi:integrase
VASLSKHGNGWNIRYVDRDGGRQSFYPGKMPRKAAESIKRHVEHLVAALKARTAVPGETAAWVADCGSVMREKLERHGLIESAPEPEVSKGVSIGDFTLGYITQRGDVKASCKTVWKRSRRLLLKFFPADRPLASITVGDAKDWRHWMLREGKGPGRGLAENTARKMSSVASQFFEDALDRCLVTANPFDHRDIPRTTRENRSRDFFVTREIAEQVLNADKEPEGRLIFALARWGGLRIPSEPLGLRWTDIDWERDRMTVRSPKTEHHEGKESRVVPIFPELRPYLREVYEAAEDKRGFVVSRFRTNSNLRTRLYRLLTQIGVEPWPKLFQNLRSTRETELAAEHPIHVVCNWIGNSIQIASRNYLQVRDADFAKASQDVRHIPLQHTPVGSGNEMKGAEAESRPRKEKPTKRPKKQDSRVGIEWALQDSKYPLSTKGNAGFSWERHKNVTEGRNPAKSRLLPFA